jgi:hypothetical protein
MWCSQYLRCQMPRSARATWLGRSGPFGIPIENRDRISRQRVG